MEAGVFKQNPHGRIQFFIGLRDQGGLVGRVEGVIQMFGICHWKALEFLIQVLTANRIGCSGTNEKMAGSQDVQGQNMAADTFPKMFLMMRSSQTSLIRWPKRGKVE